MSEHIFWTIVIAIICVIILAVSLLPIRRAYGILISILEGIGLKVSRTNIEKAILCAHYRCKEGLIASITEEKCKEIYPNYNLPLSKNELAVSEFAKKLMKEYMGEELRVCDALADAYPIEVEVGEGEKVQKSHIADAIDCMCELDSGIKRITTGKSWNRVRFGDEFKYTEKVECVEFTDCADEITSKKSQKIYLTVTRFQEHFVEPKTTFNTFLLTSQPYKSVGFTSAIVFSEIEEEEFVLKEEMGSQYKVFVEVNEDGEKTRVFIGKFNFGGGRYDKCGFADFFDVSLSCDTQERTVCGGSSEVFCNGRYVISWERVYFLDVYLKIGTFKPTTTTTLSSCSYNSCENYVTNCMCGTRKCSYGFCCSTISTCFPDQLSCYQGCHP